VRPRDVGVAQVRAYPGPGGLELRLAVIKVRAGAAIAAERSWTVEREAVPPMIGPGRHSAAVCTENYKPNADDRLVDRACAAHNADRARKLAVEAAVRPTEQKPILGPCV